MKYLYTNEPDEGCRKINGVYGRPVHTSEQATLKATGWKELPDELREEEGREEAEEEVKSDTEKAWDVPVEDLQWRSWAGKYEAEFGKPPHHKMKWQTMKAKIEALSDD